MGKGLIGNSLSGCIKDILTEKVLIDDVDTIYSGNRFVAFDLQELINHNKMYWDDIAIEILENQEKSDIDIENFKYDLWLKAEKIYNELRDNRKIVDINYKVPDGHVETATRIDSKGDSLGEEEVDFTKRYLRKVNGNLFLVGWDENYLHFSPDHKWCNNKKEFIASQLELSNEGLIKLLFPEYKAIITQLCDNMRESGEEYSYDQILAEIETLTKEQGTEGKQTISHTPGEIAEGINPKRSDIDDTSKEMVAEGKDNPNKNHEEQGDS